MTNQSIWYDEGASLTFAQLSISQIIKVNAVYEPHPPFYYLVLHFWIGLFGESDFSLRFLSVIFGVVAVFMMYKVGEQLFGREAGIISSLILAFSAFHVQYSQTARMYSLMCMLALFSMYFFLRLKDDKSNTNAFFYILSSALLMYTHIFGIFTVLAQNIFIILSSRRFIELSCWFKLQAITFLLYLPWIAVLITQIIKINAGNKYFIGTNTTGPDLTSLVDSFKLFFSGYYAIAFFAILIIISAYCIFRAKSAGKVNNFSDRKKLYLLLVWFSSFMIIPYVVSLIFFPIYMPKYAIASTLPLFILAAKGITCIKWKYLKAAAIIMILFLSMLGINSLYQKNTPPYDSFELCPDWKLFAGYIDSNAEDNDLLLIDGAAFTNTLYYHYSERRIDVEL
jgi:uncharacterized membrane protein